MAEPKTVFTYDLDGSNRLFSVPFEYLARKFVVVTAIGATRVVLTVGTDYRFISPTQIQTTLPLGNGTDGYATLEIRRYTSATERLVTFNDGSILRATDMNLSQIQTLHVAEEARDLTSDTIGVNNDGDLDARGKKIINVLDGSNPLDAVNYQQMLVAEGSVGANALSAASSASSASTSASTAMTKASEATSAALTATTKASEAASSALTSTTKASEAASSASSASTSASTATTKASEATSSAASALVQADRAESEADRAEGYANGLSLPSATGNALKFLRQNSGATGLEYVESYTKGEQDTTNGIQNSRLTTLEQWPVLRTPSTYLIMLNGWTASDSEVVIVEDKLDITIRGIFRRSVPITAPGIFAVFNLPITYTKCPYSPAILNATSVTGANIETYIVQSSSGSIQAQKFLSDSTSHLIVNLTIFK